jgi:hypothetical protein
MLNAARGLPLAPCKAEGRLEPLERWFRRITMNHDETMRELRALNAKFIHNFVTNDVASHDRILHPEFLYVGSQGNRKSRADYLRDWATGFDPEVIVYWDYRDERITLLEQVALVRSTNKYTELHDGTEVTGMVTYTDVYVREHGKWLCLQAQISPVTAQHYPDDDTIVKAYVKGRILE